MELNLGFFASHNGSNVKAIVGNIESGELIASPRVLICNNPDAPVLEFAERRMIPHYCLNARNTPDLDSAIINVMQRHGVNLAVLAGYMKILSGEVLAAFPNRVLNMHPALLPKYRGLFGTAVHEAVIASGDAESGATVHIVIPEIDAGRILEQYRVPVLARDTPNTLADRVLRVEHVLYTQVLRDIQRGLLDLDG